MQVEGYEVKVPMVGDIPNFFEVLQKESERLPELLLRSCVLLNGEPLGDRVSEIPIKSVVPLTQELMKLAGFSEGNG